MDTDTKGNVISYVDVPVEKQKPHSPQYAIPHVSSSTLPNCHAHQNSLLSHNSDVGYYSSTPVPVEYHSNTLPLPQTTTRSKVQSGSSTFKPQSKHKKHRKEGARRTKSATNIQHTHQGSDLSMGYFSNGRFYDPGPQLEIYAPASSYSDRSNNKLLSTFRAASTKTRPRVLSATSSIVHSDPEDARLV